MWVITVHSKNNIQMFEFETHEEAKDTFQRIDGHKFLSHVIYFNDYDLTGTQI